MTLLGSAAAAAVLLCGSGSAARSAQPAPTAEVIVTLDAPSLLAQERTLTSSRSDAARRVAAAQARAEKNLVAAIPSARIVYRYRLVADGFAIVVPARDVPRLTAIPGIAKVWPNPTYAPLAVSHTTVSRTGALMQGPEVIGADKLWGANLATAGEGMKIGIIDDGVDAKHEYFDPTGFSYPSGFPKGLTAETTPKVIVQRSFPPPSPSYSYARAPFDPSANGSFHATHVAGIAAGDHNTQDGALFLSGVAPDAYIGNYKALTIPTPGFGLDGNAAQIGAAIEAAVADGMNVINLSLGEPEVAPTRDFVVHAIDAAARAGVVPVIAADNQFDQYGYGSISSPANATAAITVAATTLGGTIADFSSGGPTPVSLLLKPDVAAPGVAITSALPVHQAGPYGAMSGTSMAAPQVSGAVALLMQRHPGWTVAQIKSALVQTGDPVRDESGREVSVLREGGGLIDLVRADNPLLFAAPSSVTFPVNGGAMPETLADAGGGDGSWSAAAVLQAPHRGVKVSVPSTVTVPGTFTVTADVAAGAAGGDVTGFVVLSRGSDTRRIPFWVEVNHPQLAREAALPLTHQGIYEGNTRTEGHSFVTRYRYPTAGDTSYPGPEVAYLVHVTRPIANFGVAVLSGHVVPHVVVGRDENHLLGFPGLPTALNPYLESFGESRPVAGAILPAAGTYEIVFDTRSAAQAGPFSFRYWINDTLPPKIHVVSAHGAITVSIADGGSGVDPESIHASLDGHSVIERYERGRLVVPAAPGRHLLIVTASDYQELKNMEDVNGIKPNTTTFRRTVAVS